MNSRVVPVILCGGSGTRLWPLSRAGFPKQFLCLTGDKSLFQQAAQRITDWAAPDIQVSAPVIVSNEEHRFLVSEQLREAGIEPAELLLEPIGRNTAPALTLAALAAQNHESDPILVVTPADQNVTDEQAFSVALRTAIREADSGSIVILGISPNRPETGYGYIQTPHEITNQKEQSCGEETYNKAASSKIVERFIEKPDFLTAQKYLKEDNYYWNAGIFVLKASVWLSALQHFRSDIAAACHRAWAARSADRSFLRPGKAEFATIPALSVDYAVMEHCPGSEFPIRMVPLAAGWSDLGSWDAVWNVLPKDIAGNSHLGDVITKDSSNTLVHASNRLVSIIGVEGLVVIETPDAVLVADKSRSQDIKEIVAKLSAQNREEHLLHRKVHRPWGWYDCIDEGPRFKVKRIQVNPEASLSLQKHHHRAEHWVVVKGTAEITCGEKTIMLSENQSTYIPLGEIHRLVNPGKTPLEIIEVQSGSYLGEDDIVRLEDHYGR